MKQPSMYTQTAKRAGPQAGMSALEGRSISWSINCMGCPRMRLQLLRARQVEMTKNKINTSTNKTDILVSGLKGVAGMIPLVGSLTAEVISTLIPNQRIDRIDDFLHILDEKVAGVERKVIENKFRTPYFVNLFEDSLYQVARSLTQERKEYIASLLKNGLTSDEVEVVRYKYILSLLSELNDAEVILLQLYTHLHDKNFNAKHKNIIWKPKISDDIDERIVHESYKEHLVRLGLLKYKPKTPRNGQKSEIDEVTGRDKLVGHEITPLGRVLLRYIDLNE